LAHPFRCYMQSVSLNKHETCLKIVFSSASKENWRDKRDSRQEPKRNTSCRRKHEDMIRECGNSKRMYTKRKWFGNTVSTNTEFSVFSDALWTWTEDHWL
jgi:hypothetical protein